ncbi:putative PLP-dependent enzyme possibly involved in cell wall biogenesis [Prevotella dentalis DSM 3688]|uniref:PLP-dependent enzyme possibly involved in cell wall biogenesis n=1 Tax=Prevotella dentalis (strain ATCC 49559 / DSM 3688 / JCM 13448 / NCTC 12043 / ES 2772) TaxID=908937 RepID=F9D696_PREDD|nr:aminotransferase class I/II-fold pyridoxal phosphate-dependent enzyme [Prevotella dentalis]AGB29462.1 putative PLP-dependent enzyme possibly involved in cell wall biogenesis [Prevotella dentalis DSM 3688]EGQ12491.1 pyridoxal-phosphate-dependent aminotransferase [Prevotella dentalis DSM 3688]
MQKPEKRIILCLAHMSGNEMKYVQEAFDTNWVVPLGPNVNGFESDLKQFVTGTAPDGAGSSSRKGEQSGMEEALERKQVVALASGTSAVHLALVALGVRAGDEVMCQSFTFCASSHPVRYLGATPVFVDSEPDSWNMDPELLETAIRDRMEKTGRKPRAIIVVYLYGMPARIRDIMAVAEKYGIPLIEDAAEALGSRYDGQVCGTFGQYGVLSFNGNKMITTSGGGALICPDAASKERIMFFATQAREAFPYYQHEEIGYNYRMSNICAGIGRGQMTVLNAHIAHHQHLAAYYREALRDVPGIAFHDNPNAHADSNFWLNTITIDPSVRVAGQERAYAEAVHGAVGGAAGVVHATGRAHTDCEPNDNVEAMRMFLDQAGIESRPLWKPMHRQPVYRDYPAYVNGVSESLFKIGLCLPSGPLVTDENAAYIVDRIKAAIM